MYTLILGFINCNLAMVSRVINMTGIVERTNRAKSMDSILKRHITFQL